nr:hypothetical protein [Tanacetum cinerariifolium]
KFWTTAKAKNINEEAQIHTKVDGKKVIISKALIRRDLRFGDKGGIDCFSNEVIFEQLTLMGGEYKKDKAKIAQETSSKRAGEELDQERCKKQKVEEDKESEELKQCLKIIPDDGNDVTINATPLSVKTPIVHYKIYKEGKKN